MCNTLRGNHSSHMEIAWQSSTPRFNISWRRVSLALLFALAITIAVPPLRRGAALVASKAVLLALSPFAPDIGGFHDLPAPSRIVAADGTAAAVAAKAGVKVEGQYWTVGAYDGVLILSAEKESDALRLLVALAAAGNVETETMQALTAPEFEALVK